MTRVSIKCDPLKRKKSMERLKAYERKTYIDRIPICFGVEARYLLAQRGIGFLEYFESPESNFYHQIMNFKWRMENIEDDFLGCQEVRVFPDFQNTTTAGLFDETSIIWDDVQPPRVKPFILTIQELRKCGIPDMDKGMAARKRMYIQRMKELAKDYIVEINGEPVPIVVSMGWHETMMSGAIDMLGENLFLWMYEYPEDIKNFLNILTDASILFEKTMRAVSGEKREGADAIADGGEMLSADMFKEFMVPCYLKFYNAFKGQRRGLHMCGKIDHLLGVLKDDLRITMLNGFGFSVNPENIASIVGSAFFYSGGINPMLLWKGAMDDIKKEVLRYVEVLGRFGTYMMADGYNVVPGTSVETMNAIVAYPDETGMPRR